MGKNIVTKETMTSYGWSDENESIFFKNIKSIISDDYKGTFTIKKVKGHWYWYYKFSSYKITPRTKYLCSCDVKTEIGQTSFEHSTQVFLEKVKHNFSTKKSMEKNLSLYIDEFIQICFVEGGLTMKKQHGKEVMTFSGYTDSFRQKNTSTMKKHIRSLREFKEFCIDNNIQTSSVIKYEFRNIFKEYFSHLQNRNKRDRNGKINPLSNHNLKKGSIKLNLQSVRGFLTWLCTPESEDGRELFKESHNITPDFQNHLININFGRTQLDDKIVDFDVSDYEKSVKEMGIFIRGFWFDYCKHNGDREYFRNKNLFHPEKSKFIIMKNQPKNNIVMSNIVYFVSYLQLKYGFRITEILHSFRDKESHNQYTDTTKVSSFFRKEKRNSTHYYILDIRNSKKKDRKVPIDDILTSGHKPPKSVPYELVMDNKGRSFYNTNIIDVIFEIFYPKSHPKTFPSPNLSNKSDRGYSTTYYINLFKEKLVLNKRFNWKDRGITSTHDLRLFFVSYHLRKGVNPTSVGDITGQSINTIMMYYNRLSLKGQLETLQLTDFYNILHGNRN
ncbi:MAG: hypothetical protein O2U61_01150 [Candidatus Bathyarchaeota archaeon]|nr:hypothetical protein [Candidatus Bathyarchaeota archaeon]